MKGFKFQISNYFDCYIGNNFQDDKGYNITLGRACKQIAKLHCQDPLGNEVRSFYIVKIRDVQS